MEEDGDRSSGHSRRRKGARSAPNAQPRRSEIHLPLTPGTLIRARYVGPGGGSLNIFCGSDIALHVNPRPHEGLVLNSHFGGWGPEERPHGYPFPHGEDVMLSVRVRSDCFVISAKAAGEDSFEYTYAFRHPTDEDLAYFAIDVPGLIGLAVQPGA